MLSPKSALTSTSSSIFRVVVAALGLTVLLAITASAAQAKAKSHKPASKVTINSPVVQGSGYLSLGDSVTFGYREPTVVPAPNYHDQASFIAFPELLGKELHLTVANPACSGETSGSLINVNIKSNGCENQYRKSFPLHVHYTGSQLAYAVSYLKTHKNVRLVSLMIGANDLFICQNTTPDACASPAEQAAVFKQISTNVHTILSAVRNKAHYRGQIAIVNYYSLNYTSALLTGASTGLNKAMDSAAKPFHVEIADGFGTFKSASVDSGNDPCTAGLLTQLGMPGTCGVHPSAAGQSLLAQALLDAIKI
jgi:lysophospholipase L1-like esterase